MLRQKFLLEDDFAFVNCDEEALQISIYEKTVQDTLLQHSIHIAKPPSSTTEVYQACDAGKVFLSWNTVLKSVTDNKVKINTFMSDRLKDIYS